MLLVDTSVWVDHFRRGDAGLAARLRDGGVLAHPVVVEELACGNLANRQEVLGLLGALPKAPSATHEELLSFIEKERLFGRGLGAGDVQLLAAARLGRCRLWTRDKALLREAERLGVAEEG